MEDYGFPPVFPDDTEPIEGAAAEDATSEVDLTKKPKKVYSIYFSCVIYGCVGR